MDFIYRLKDAKQWIQNNIQQRADRGVYRSYSLKRSMESKENQIMF